MPSSDEFRGPLGRLTLSAHILASKHATWWGELLLSEVLPAVPARIFERSIRSRVEVEKLDPELDQDMQRHTVHTVEDIKDAHRADLARRDAQVRKAQAYLIVVTLACSFGFGILTASTVLSTAPTWLSRCLGWAALSALAMLWMSAYSALRVFGPTEWFDVYLQHRIEWVSPDDASSEKAWLVKIIYFNQAYALIGSRYLRAAYVGLRNAIFIMFLTLATLVAVRAFTDSTRAAPPGATPPSTR